MIGTAGLGERKGRARSILLILLLVGIENLPLQEPCTTWVLLQTIAFWVKKRPFPTHFPSRAGKLGMLPSRKLATLVETSSLSFDPNPIING